MLLGLTQLFPFGSAWPERAGCRPLPAPLCQRHGPLCFAGRRSQGTGCAHGLPEGKKAASLKPISFVSETIFSGSQGGDRLLQGISCPGVYIWSQKKEREAGKGVGCRSGGTRSKRASAKTSQAKREAGHGACPSSQVNLMSLQEFEIGKLSASGRQDASTLTESLFSLLTPLGLGSWPCGFRSGARYPARQPVS